jgi:cytochrome c oxidase subunit 3
MSERQPAFQFVDLRQQDEAAHLGMWVFLATEVLFFGGLILIYIVYRIGYPEEFVRAARQTKIVIGTANTAILLTSSFLVAWAVAAARLREGRAAALLLWLAASLGILFLALKGIEYRLEYAEGLLPGVNYSGAGPDPGSGMFFSFYIVATGLHALHVAIGIAALSVIGLRTFRGSYADGYEAPLAVTALYWHFVDVVWIFLFALIYLPGRAG